MVVIIPFLLLTGIPTSTTSKAAVLNDLLQPAVVALAYPLYMNNCTRSRVGNPVLTSVFCRQSW